MELNKAQQEAVDHKTGPLLIIAGAGTGKTKVLISRIENIITKGWAKSHEILALTFTEKAAKEMKERLDVFMPYGYEDIEVSTFHSFADKILRQEALYLGLDPLYSLMTASDSYVFFRKHLFEFSLDIFRPLGNPTRFIEEMLKHFSRLQDEDVSPDKYIEFAKNLPYKTEAERTYFDEINELAKVYKEYSELKDKNSKLDFGDLIFRLMELFRKKPNILKKYHEKYKYILVDEYQDTNYIQNVLVNTIALGTDQDKASDEAKKNANITVVGDDDQAIYKFRGAAISNIIQFRTVYPDVTKVVLTENYRSRQEILDAAYKLISNNNPNRLEITESINKKLVAKAQFKPLKFAPLKTILTKFDTQEADEVVKEIKRLVIDEKLYKYSDIAILIRANNHSDLFIQNLRYYGIPYKFGGNRNLYNTDEVKQLISFLRIVADYTDDSSLFNLLSLKFLKLAGREVIDIFRNARRKKEDVYSYLLNNVDYQKKEVKTLIKAITNGIERVKEKDGLGQLLFDFFNTSGWKDYLIEENSVKSQYAIENINQYFNVILKFEQTNRDFTIYDYLDYLDYSIEKGDSPTLENDPMEGVDAVNILTVHGSKGLEFPVVFLVNLVSARFPSNNRSDKFEIDSSLIKEYIDIQDEREQHLAEERRLFYVGATRAKEVLYLTASTYYGDAKSKKSPSIFLNEILERNVSKEFGDLANNEEVLKLPIYISKETQDIVDYKKLGMKQRNEYSYTQLRTYEMCPRQYKYRYVMHLPTPTSPTLTFGNVFHRTLKLFYDRQKKASEAFEGMITPPTYDDLISLFESNWSNSGFENKKQEDIRYEKGKESIKLYYDNLYTGKEKIIDLEKSFKYQLNEYKIVGRIDRMDYLRQENGITYVEIIDYKTGKAKDAKDLKDDWQLVFYAMVVKELWGYEVEKASYWFVEHGKKVSIDISTKTMGDIKQRILEIINKIRSGDFTVPSGHQCEYCDYQNICEEAVL